jgi:hypothetical protein
VEKKKAVLVFVNKCGKPCLVGRHAICLTVGRTNISRLWEGTLFAVVKAVEHIHLYLGKWVLFFFGNEDIFKEDKYI